MRFDVLKTISATGFENAVKKHRAGEGVSVVKYLYDRAAAAPKHYFIAVNIGYLIAIICTVVVMLIFDHGQPALLYLVPGTILMVLATAACKGELGVLWAFSEDEFITPADDGDEEDSDDDKKEAKAGDKAKAEKKVAADKQKAS